MTTVQRMTVANGDGGGSTTISHHTHVTHSGGVLGWRWTNRPPTSSDQIRRTLGRVWYMAPEPPREPNYPKAEEVCVQ